MRIVGYLFAGWLLFGIATTGLTGLLTGNPSSFVFGVAAVAGLVWLVRSYRKGGPLERRVRALQARLPLDPLESDAIVNAWSIHGGDQLADARLRETYDGVRGSVEEVHAALETGGDAARKERLQAKLDHVEDYLRAVDLLAAHEPELVGQAISEHAEARSLVDRAGLPVDRLLDADAKLQGARAALRREDERPVEAIRLASEAEQIVVDAAEAKALATRVDAVESALRSAENRYAPAALAETRGLPDVARGQLERGALRAAHATIDLVEAHLGALERAAVSARPKLEAAEEAVDAAFARGDEAAPRAAGLTQQARAQLDADRPDWLEIDTLAERALRMVDEPLDVEAPAPLGVARARAEQAREEVWAWALTSGPRADATRAVAEQVDQVLAEANGSEDVALYRRAEALARAAIDEAATPAVKRAARS
jgi:hypothetical protein